MGDFTAAQFEHLAKLAKDADSAVSTVVAGDADNVPLAAIIVLRGRPTTGDMLAAIEAEYARWETEEEGTN